MSASSTDKSNDKIFSPEFQDLLHAYLSHTTDKLEHEKLRGQLVSQLVPYVKKIASGLARRTNDPLEDLIQVGNIGLLKALDKYNPLMGTSFKTYATYFITGEIRHYLRDKTTMIKAPREIYELYYRMNQIVAHLTTVLGQTPTDLQIAEELQCPVTKVVQAQEIEQRRLPVSLDQFSVGENGGDTLYIERLVDQRQINAIENHENKMAVDTALAGLKEELRLVVQMTYYEDLSQIEIAERLGISQMQVSRRLRKALDLLAKTLQKT